MRSKLLWYVAIPLFMIIGTVFLYSVRSIAIPFLLALLLAYFLDPVVDAMEKRCVSRTIAVSLVFVLFLVLSSGLMLFLVPSLKDEIAGLRESLPRYAESLFGLLPPSVLDFVGISDTPDLQSLLARAVEGVQSLSFDVINQVLHFLSRAFSSTLGFLLAIFGYFITPVYFFYLLKDFDRFTKGVLSLVPPRFRESVLKLTRQIDGVMSGFIRGQMMVCLSLSVLYCIGLGLIGIDLALVIGIVSGIAFIIPYLGTIIGVLLAGSMAAVQFQDFFHPALVVLLFCVVQALEGTLISPKLVGDRVGLHPLGNILAVLIGGEIFGFLGLLLAVPVAASITVIFKEVLSLYKKSDLFIAAPAGAGEYNAQNRIRRMREHRRRARTRSW